MSAPVLQPGIKTKVGPGPGLPASTTRKETPSPTSTFRSRTSEAEPARTAAAFAIIPAIKKTIGRGNKFTAKLISPAGHRQRVKCGSAKNGAGGAGDIEGKAARELGNERVSTFTSITTFRFRNWGTRAPSRETPGRLGLRRPRRLKAM